MQSIISTLWVLLFLNFLTAGILQAGQSLARADEIVGVKIMEKELVGN